MKPTDIRVREWAIAFEEYRYRSPIKFGGVALDRVTLLNVHARVERRDGVLGDGFGSMPLGNIWAFPSRQHPYGETLAAMQALAPRVAERYLDWRDYAHPVELTHALEPRILELTGEVGRECQLREPIPPLAALVVASPFDAALHDAFGRLLNLNCYRTYGPEFLGHPLERYLGGDFRGLTLDRFVRTPPPATLPLYHLVGALDPLTPAEVTAPVGDGLPEHLGDWIAREGLTHLKIKLNGDDSDWDLERILSVHRVASHQNRPMHYSLDFNECCGEVEKLVALLRRLQEHAPDCFASVQYIEQPTARDLFAPPEQPMHAAARLKPIVIDESLLDLASLRRARELGYTGAALKACKGQTQSLLLGAAIQAFGMFRCVQDLTCPGASLVHSAGLAAHLPGIAAIEANARQYCPAANRAWLDDYPGLLEVRDGSIRTAELTGPGLSTGEIPFPAGR